MLEMEFSSTVKIAEIVYAVPFEIQEMLKSRNENCEQFRQVVVRQKKREFSNFPRSHLHSCYSF